MANTPIVLTPKHRKVLEWFSSNAGSIIGWPDKLSDGTLLATKAKGIYKPKWSIYALSIRHSMSGKYDDKDLQAMPNNNWQYKYRPEMIDGKDIEDHYTNSALLKNMKDNIPIGVFIQIKTKPNPLYKVLGIGLVKAWQDGFFVVEACNLSD